MCGLKSKKAVPQHIKLSILKNEATNRNHRGITHCWISNPRKGCGESGCMVPRCRDWGHHNNGIGSKVWVMYYGWFKVDKQSYK